MAVLVTQCDATVLGKAHLAVVAAEHRGVGARDAEQTAVRDGLHRGVEERRRGAVWVEVDNIELLLRCAVVVPGTILSKFNSNKSEHTHHKL